MIDSYVEEYLPFKSDPNVREEYLNAYGTIRIGKILEDLDALAGSIAYVHCDDGLDDTPPLTIVTGESTLTEE
jgi:acyl-coenzyme A thioesterase 9